MKGNVKIYGDFGVVEEAFQRGKISLRERDRLFTLSRKAKGTFEKDSAGNIVFVPESANGVLFGGSDIQVLEGVSPYNTPEYLVRHKIDPDNYPEPVDAKQQESFDNGHIFEAAIAQKCAQILSEGLNTEVRYEPCDVSFNNTEWPNIVANIDGFFWVNGKRQLIEVKTAALGGDAWNEFKDRKIPIGYQLQAATYATILGMDGAFFCVWNKESLDDKNFRVLWYPCPKDHDKVLDRVQKIAEDAQKGIVPSDKGRVLSPKQRAKSFEKQFSRLDPDLKPIKASEELKNVFSRLEELNTMRKAKDTEAKAIKRPFMDEKNKADREGKAAAKDLTKEVDTLSKEIGEICASSILPLIQAGSCAYIEDGEDVVEISVKRGLSFDESAKRFLREKYPDAWEALNAFKPTYSWDIERKAKY